MLQYLQCGKPHNHFWHHWILNAFSCPCSLLKTHRENCLDWEEDSADRFFLPCVKKCHLYLDIIKPFLQLLQNPLVSVSLHKGGSRDNFALSESRLVVLGSVLRLCLADLSSYKILPRQQCRSPGPVPFLLQPPLLWLGQRCSWYMSSPLNHIWSNHHYSASSAIR